ncbi:Signal peptidase IB [compost metagenome]
MNKDVNKIFKEIFEWILCFVIAFIIYLVVNYFFGTVSGVKQVSMKPTAVEGDKVLIQRTKVFKKEIDYGSIITFEAPLEDGDYNDPKAKYPEYYGLNSFLFNFVGVGKISYIKRVIGLPGDHILIGQDGNVYKNDIKLDEPYLRDGTTDRNGPYTDLVVPDGYIFAMGDNRLESKDSRAFGCIPVSKVDGYVITRVWPLNKLGDLNK